MKRALPLAAAISLGAAALAASAQENPSGYLAGLIRLTPERIPMDPIVAGRCMGPTPEESAAMRRRQPHTNAWAHLYANDLALDYRRRNPAGHDYPLGAVFLKEEYQEFGWKEPTLATVMIRRQAAGRVTDWEFSTIELPAQRRSVIARGGTCAKCHAGEKSTGYISPVTEAVLLEFLAPETRSVRGEPAGRPDAPPAGQ